MMYQRRARWQSIQPSLDHDDPVWEEDLRGPTLLTL